MTFATLQINQKEWRAAGQRLIEMAIAEFLYEEIITVKKIPDLSVTHQSNNSELGHQENSNRSQNTGSRKTQRYQLELAHHIYQFNGYQFLLGHWHIEENSVVVITNNQSLPAWNLHEFIAVFSIQAEIKPFTKAYLIKEMNNTWIAEAHLFKSNRLPSSAVLHESHSKIEGMLRGHPWLIMSKGRMGFGYDDYLSAAPELSPEVKVLWLAVHQDLAEFRSTDQWQAKTLYQRELDQFEINYFRQLMLEKGLDSEHYFLIPVHAWQWHQWLLPTYSNEIVDQRIVELGVSQDSFVPMQSIRTLCNITEPKRHYIKLPVSIFNTAVYRGLPSKRNLAAPAVTQWLKSKLDTDQDLKATGVIFLGEVATLTIQQPCYDQIEGAPYQFKELFGCLWRESVDVYVPNHMKVLSQAALLHRDIDGKSILQTLITASGLSPLDWLKRFAEVSVSPLLVSLYKYGLAFSPHGENTMLVHENGIPQKLVLKDFIDDVNLVDEDFIELSDLPEEGKILLRHPALELSHFIFTGLFIVHYRYICNVFLQDYPELNEVEFWQVISDVIAEFHSAHPELENRIQKFAMFREEFEKICLNRVRLFTTSYNDEAERPVPVFLDPMANPISPITLEKWSNITAVNTSASDDQQKLASSLSA